MIPRRAPWQARYQRRSSPDRGPAGACWRHSV